MGTQANNKEESKEKPSPSNKTKTVKDQDQKLQGLNKLFLDELGDMYSSENQLAQALPNLIEAASSLDLKEALTKQLQDTKEQIKRIKTIFYSLNQKAKKEQWDAIEGLLKIAAKLAHEEKSPILDAAIISVVQKFKHFEIASYGTLISFAEHLNFEQELIDLIKDTLEEENTADKTLTNIAEGSLLFGGVNKKAAKLTKGKLS